MQKLSYEPEFLSFIVRSLCEKGGTRMQLGILELTKEMQKLDPLDRVNLYRKQYGNTEGALNKWTSTMKNTCFYIDNIVVKMRDRASVEGLFAKGGLSGDDYKLYCETYEQNQLKLIDVMRINKQNKCKVCGEVYKEIINKPGECSKNKAHDPLHKFD